MKTLDDVVALLNTLMELDPEAMRALCDNRVPCARDIVESNSPWISTVVVGGEPDAPTLGMLGIINGIVAGPGEPRVCAVYGDIEKDGHRRLLGFNRTDALGIPPPSMVAP